MSYSEEYKEKVKQTVGKLFDYTYQGKFYGLTLDADEDVPFVHAWYRGQSVKAYGWHKGEPLSGIFSPPENETWSFLECCELVLGELQKIAAAPMAESKTDAN